MERLENFLGEPGNRFGGALGEIPSGESATAYSTSSEELLKWARRFGKDTDKFTPRSPRTHAVAPPTPREPRNNFG